MILFFHGAGKASIAAISTIVASTPLQPASIDTAKPLVVLCRILPITSTLGSKPLTRSARASPGSWSTALRRTAGRLGQLASEQHTLDDEEKNEKLDHGPDYSLRPPGTQRAG
jgi:hypothetical protein